MNDLKSLSEEIGFFQLSILDTHLAGDNAPDIIVGIYNRNYLVEIKSEKGRLTAGQKKMQKEWRGNYLVVHSSSELINLIFEDLYESFTWSYQKEIFIKAIRYLIQKEEKRK